MSQARESILKKLKAQVAGADYSKLPVETGFDYPEISAAAMREKFVALLQANHAELHSVKRSEMAATIKSVLQARDIDQLMVGQKSLWPALETSLGDTAVITEYFDSIDGNKEILFDQVPASLTHSFGAIAATGSIVVWPSAEEPRTLSLVPPLHIVVVEENNLVADFASLIQQDNLTQGIPTNLVFISGPSKTADIQQTLAYGAHGPKELVVLLVAAED